MAALRVRTLLGGAELRAVLGRASVNSRPWLRRVGGTASQAPTEPSEPVEDGQRIQRDPRDRPAPNLRDPHDLYDSVNPERYFEHAEQVTPEDKPLDYVRLKTNEKMADARAEAAQAAHGVREMAKDAVDAIAHPIKTAKEAVKSVADRMAPPSSADTSGTTSPRRDGDTQ